MKRRDFIIGAGAVAGTMAIAGIPAKPPQKNKSEFLIYTGNFKTGDFVSVTGTRDSDGLYLVKAVSGPEAIYPIAGRDA